MSLFQDESRAALLSSDEVYRYLLTRTWAPHLKPALFIMLNPSTADGTEDDPTIRRCIGFARAWGYGGVSVVNLYAWRATDPAELRTCSVALATGPDNDRYIEEALDAAAVVVAAWGATRAPGLEERVARVRHLVQQTGNRLLCLGTTNGGYPRHPLYVSGSTKLYPWLPNPV